MVISDEKTRKNINMFKIVEHWAQKQDKGEIDWFNNPMPHCVGCKWQCPFTSSKAELSFYTAIKLNACTESLYDSINTFKDKWESSGTFLDKAHLFDHALGGEASPDNLVPLCRRCHQSMSRTMFESKEEAIRWIKNVPLCHGAFQTYTDLCFCENNHERLFRTKDPRFISEYERIQSIVQKTNNWKLVWKSPEGDYIESIHDMEIYDYGKDIQTKLTNVDTMYAHIECIADIAIEDLEDSDVKPHILKRYKKALKVISKSEHSLNIPLEIDCLSRKELLDIFINIEQQLARPQPTNTPP